MDNKKLITDLRIGLANLRKDTTQANQILATLSTKKINLDLIDEATKNKLINAAKAIKKEINSIGGDSASKTASKAMADGMLKSFSEIEIKSKEMTKIVTETFKANGKEALTMAKNQQQADNIVSTSSDKTGKKVVENLKAMYDAEQKFSGYKPTSKVTTDDSSAKLNKIQVAYQRLALEGKTSQQSLLGMANQVQRTTSEYGLLGNSLSSANTQQLKYRNEAARLTQAQTQQSATAAAAQNKANTQAIKQAQNTEKQGLAELKLYTQEKSQTSQYSKMASELQRISGESNLAMSSSNAGASMSDCFKVSGVYALAAQSIFMLRSAVKDMIETNRSFEVGMVDLGRVIDNVSGSELKLFGQDSIDKAKEYGLAIQDVQDSYVALAKAGVQKNDLSSMVNTISLGLNTSEITSGSEMAELLTTSLRQMNIEFSQSEKVLDSWNYLADKSTADTADFAEAISKTGATSAQMGISM